MVYRLIKTVYGLYAASAFLLVILPVSVLIITLPSLGMRRAVGRAGVKLACWAMGLPLRVEGLAHIPSGPCICVANHASYLDGLILTAALPGRFTFLVQSGAASWPWVGRTITRMGVSFVNRGSAREAAASLRQLMTRVSAGESFSIFAEGTFEPRPGLLHFHNGAFAIASKAGVPVLPAVIVGSRSFLPDGAKLPRYSPLRIQFFPAIPLPEGPHAAQQLKEQTRAVILAHCGEPDAAHPLPISSD